MTLTPETTRASWDKLVKWVGASLACVYLIRRVIYYQVHD